MNGRQSSYYECRTAFFAWCESNNFDAKDSELWAAFLAGVEWSEKPIPLTEGDALKQALISYDTGGNRGIAPLVAAIKTYRNITGETLVRSKAIIEKGLQARATPEDK